MRWLLCLNACTDAEAPQGSTDAMKNSGSPVSGFCTAKTAQCVSLGAMGHCL